MSVTPLYSILDNVNNQKNKKLRIAALHKHSSKHLKALFDFSFNPNIKWLLPEGVPPYEPCDDDEKTLYVRLYQELPKLQVFLNIGPYPNLQKSRREMLFISVLESIHPNDALLLCGVKDGILPYEHINAALVAEAFPIFTQTWKNNPKI